MSENKKKILMALAVIVGVVILWPSFRSNLGGVPRVPSFNSASSTVYAVGHQLSTKVLDQRGGRAYAILCNNDSYTKYISFSATSITSTTSAGVRLAASTCYEIDQDNLYTGEIEVIQETATSTSLIVTEFIGY